MASPWPRRDEVVPAVNNPDVADLMAEFLPEEVQRLERVFHHHEVGDPIWGLFLWQPTDPDDIAVRTFLLGIVRDSIRFYKDAQRKVAERRMDTGANTP